MRFQSILKIAIRSLNRNKMRSFLTMLGVIIGVAAVITMLAVGQGARDAIKSQIAALGTNVILIFPGSFTQGGVRMEAGSASQLTEDDVAAIRKQCPAVAYITPIVRTTNQVKIGNQNWRTTIYGVYPEYVDIRDWPLKEGVNTTDADGRGGTKVCIVGMTVVKNLFPENPSSVVGQIIRIKNLPFKIIGVLSEKGQNAMGQDQDDQIIAPFSTVQKKLMGITFANSLTASARSEQVINEASAEISQTLNDRRHGQAENSSFTIRTQTDLGNAADQTSRTLSILLAAIAGVSLIVGGIGIMNIMLVSVTERTREIGIRMAVGARGTDVLLQFLVEALVMSFAGGMLGIATGIGVSTLISKLQGWSVTVSPLSILLGFGFSAAIGIFFGWYPARKAAALKPIDALRYE